MQHGTLCVWSDAAEVHAELGEPRQVAEGGGALYGGCIDCMRARD